MACLMRRWSVAAQGRASSSEVTYVSLNVQAGAALPAPDIALPRSVRLSLPDPGDHRHPLWSGQREIVRKRTLPPWAAPAGQRSGCRWRAARYREPRRLGPSVHPADGSAACSVSRRVQSMVTVRRAMVTGSRAMVRSVSSPSLSTARSLVSSASWKASSPSDRRSRVSRTPCCAPRGRAAPPTCPRSTSPSAGPAAQRR